MTASFGTGESRFLGPTMLAPGQVAPGQDMDAIELIAYGDLTIVGIGDLISVGITVAVAGTFEEGIGVM